MNESSHPAHTTAPDSIPALLLHLDDLSPALAYALHGQNGEWRLVVLGPDELPDSVRLAAGSQALLVVALGADLRYAEPGTITTVAEVER